MTIKIYGFVKNKLEKLLIKHNSFKFSGGEVQVRVPDISDYSSFHLYAYLYSSDDIMELLLVTDAIRNLCPNAGIGVTMPYIPYARQDRPCVPGEALSIKVFANLINAQNYSFVTVWDAHSDVATSLINKCKNVEQSALIQSMPIVANILVSPDAGANKKIFKLAAAYPDIFTQVIRADKTRNVKDGSITGTVIYCDDLKGQDVLIVDDICDGGRTFIELAKALKEKNCGGVFLYVTHGIFSKGVEVFNGLIRRIYTPNPFRDFGNDSIVAKL